MGDQRRRREQRCLVGGFPLSAPHAIVGNVLAPEPLGRVAVLIEGSKILDVVRSPRSGELPAERREVRGFICPGFIDLQINGAIGIDVGPDARALEGLGRELPKTGVTSFPRQSPGRPSAMPTSWTQ